MNEDVCPTKGEIRDVMYFARWYVGEPMQDTIGRRGTWGLSLGARIASVIY